MPDLLRINCLDVGQGTGVLAELYDEDPATHAPTHTILFDLGSEQAKREAGVPTVDFVVRTLNRMEQPTLDAVFLSHSDADHINLLPDVLKKFTAYEEGRNEGRGTLKVGYALYGGDWNRYKKGRARNVLETLAKYMESNDSDNREPVQPFAMSNYQKDGVVGRCEVGFADLRLLIGNAANTSSGRPTDSSYSAKDGFGINTMSLVMVLDAFDSQYVMTGDATGATMAMANRRLRYAQQYDHLKNVIMVTAPHHGSIKTALALGRVKANERPRNVVKTFVQLLHSRTLDVSAGVRKGFSHPDAELVRLFADPLRRNTEPNWTREPGYSDRHFYTAYFRKKTAAVLTKRSSDTEPVSVAWPSIPGWRTVQTRLPLFTSLYYSEKHLDNATNAWPPNPGNKVVLNKLDGKKFRKPPYGVHWRYETTPVGDGNSYSLERITNRRAQQLFAEWEALGQALTPQPQPRPHTPATPPRPASPAPLAPPVRPADGRPARAAVPRRRPAAPAASIAGLRRLRVIP